MKKLLIVAALMLLWAASAFPQTTVNLTVTDTPDNQLWNNGTWSVKLQPAAGNLSQTNSFTLLSGGGSLSAQSGSLSSTATASITLPATANIAPTSAWQFTVCPQASAGCFQQAVTVSTSSPQTLAINPPSIRINLSTATPPISAYATGEITGAVIGSQFYLFGVGIQVCSVISGNICTTWAASGGISPNSPVPANQAQGPQFNVVNYGSATTGTAKKTATAVTTNTSATVTDATTSPWVAGDVGSFIQCTSQTFGTNTFNITTAKISAFNSASSITVNTTANGQSGSNTHCVWFKQRDTAAFLAAGTAAIGTLRSNRPIFGPTLSYPGQVYCPPGGYAVDGPFFVQNSASQSEGIGFRGADQSSCIIYLLQDAAVSNTSWIMNSTQNFGFTLENFTVDCSFFNFALAAPGIRINASGNAFMRHIELDACGTSGDTNGLIQVVQSSNIIGDHITINASSGGGTSSEPPISVNNSAGITVRNFITTNPGGAPTNITGSGGQASAGGPRNGTGAQVIFENSVFDEGGVPGALSINSGSSVNLIGVSMFAGTVTILSVDGTSSAYLNDVQLIPFNGSCGGSNRNAITISSGGFVEATGSSIQSCGTSSAVTGPAGATFVSAGGNDIRNCTGTLPCPLVTAANFSTAFSGGIVPKSSETHTPNTCYAVTGNLLATAQNLCTFLNDQNYQVLNITAQSGGTTPANSSCTGAPVITLSDGTRTATLTMTTGKTQWSSAVDVSTVNSVFASGTTLTVSIGANTCATPPANVAVSYILQSVLNQ